MSQIGSFVWGLLASFLAFLLMIVLAVVSFFLTVFVVDFGASLAGYPQNPYTILSSTILVAASIIAGGMSPIQFLSQPIDQRSGGGPFSRSGPETTETQSSGS